MKKESVLRLSALAVALASATGGAFADTQTTATTSLNLNNSAAMSASDSTSADGLATGSAQVFSTTRSAFDANTGVLTGVSANLNLSSETKNLTVSNTSSANGSGTVVTQWSLGGTSTLITQNGVGSNNNWSNVSIAATAPLNSFVGVGNLASYSFSTALTANKTGGSGNLVSSISTSSLDPTHSLTYTYTKHSNASFTSGVDSNSLVYNFGHVNGGTGADHGFNIYGLAGGLGLTNFTVSFLSGNDVFAITGGSSVSAGGSGAYNAHFNAQSPSVFTNYSGTYRITFTDNVSGLNGGMYASNSVKQNYIDITMTANVPEPETYALFLAGLSAIGFIARRRRPQS